MFKSKLVLIWVGAIIFFLPSLSVYAQVNNDFIRSSLPSVSNSQSSDSPLTETQVPPPAQNEYYRAKVTQIVNEDDQGTKGYDLLLKVLMLEGPEKSQTKEVSFQSLGLTSNDKKTRVGDTVVVIKTQNGKSFSYYVVEKFRLDSSLLIVCIFVVITVIVSRWKGFFSLLGLTTSILIIVFAIVPALISGQNPVFVGLWGSVVIALTSMYLAHGISRRTNVAVLSTFITLAISVAMSIWFVSMTSLFGFGTEEAVYLNNGSINLRGLLLCGILIGTLGILDDITVSQVSVVEELYDVDNSQSMWQLFKRGSNVGREHIASLINTLALAYVGASFPLLLTFTINQGQPLWVIVNSENIMEEIVRTLVGSLTLILAVPIATILAAYFCKHPFKIRNKKLEEFYKKLEPKEVPHHHHH